MRLLYSLVLYAGMPLVLLRLLWRGRRASGYWRGWGERFGLGPVLAGPVIWLHAVSVGEVIAAAPLVRSLQRRLPGYRLLLTTTTPTGRAQARRLFGDQVEHRYCPYDLPGAARRFLGRTRPALALIMETEIWPNLYHGCRRAGVPLVLVNARLSQRSARGYARLARLTGDTLRPVSAGAAQTDTDARRLIELGAPAPRVHVTGSMKFDLQLPDDLRERGRQLRASWGSERPVWIAASTHAGEEEGVLEAHRQILARHPTALLILVPRHPERFEACAELCRGAGYRLSRRSEGTADRATGVLLGDTMGELLVLYAGADAAFIGGSLVAVGGHNALEPAALGLPVATGPHTRNFAAIYRALYDAGAAATVDDAGALAQVIGQWLGDEQERRMRGMAARQVVERNRGAVERVMALIVPLLEASPGAGAPPEGPGA